MVAVPQVIRHTTPRSDLWICQACSSDRSRWPLLSRRDWFEGLGQKAVPLFKRSTQENRKPCLSAREMGSVAVATRHQPLWVGTDLENENYLSKYMTTCQRNPRRLSKDAIPDSIGRGNSNGRLRQSRSNPGQKCTPLCGSSNKPEADHSHTPPTAGREICERVSG